MIQVNELRISNLVDYNGMYLSVSEIYTPKPRKPVRFDGVECVELHCGGFITATMDDIKPIPLTEEILLKCGFVCFAESEVSKGFSIGTNPVTNDHMVTLTWLKDIFKNNLDNYPFFKNGHHVIKHLHQLQNLYFALTGQELEVKL